MRATPVSGLAVETRMQNGDDEDIRRKAYQIWEEEGRPEGRHEEHWRKARENFMQDKGAAEISGDTTPSDVPPAIDAAADQPGGMHEQDKAMIPENSAERLTQTAEPEPGSAPTPPAKRPRTQRRKTSTT